MKTLYLSLRSAKTCFSAWHVKKIKQNSLIQLQCLVWPLSKLKYLMCKLLTNSTFNALFWCKNHSPVIHSCDNCNEEAGIWHSCRFSHKGFFTLCRRLGAPRDNLLFSSCTSIMIDELGLHWSPTLEGKRTKREAASHIVTSGHLFCVAVTLLQGVCLPAVC